MYSSSIKLLRRVSKVALHQVMGTITHVDTQQPVISLTFDDGPHSESTPRLLDILEKHQAHATFFMVGQSAQQYPQIVARAAQSGHAIGNHTWDHPSVPLITGRERRFQLTACTQATAPYGQRLFRPPYGHQSIASRFDALLLGYKVVTWNAHGYDWLDHDANWIVNYLTPKIQPGSIILFHDVLYHTIEPHYANREPMLKAVDTLLEQLGHRFRFVTVPELLQCGRPQYNLWYRKANREWLNNLNSGQIRQYAYRVK